MRILTLSLLCSLLSGCASLTYRITEKVDPVVQKSEGYDSLRHPRDNSIGALMELFIEDDAPPLSSFDGCEKKHHDFSQEKMTEVRNPEEIGTDVVRYNRRESHWCFYVKLLEVTNPLVQNENKKDRETRFVNSFLYLSPIARGFFREYGDIQYLVLAGELYQGISRKFYSRPLEFGPEVTQGFVSYWRKVRQEEEKRRAED